MNKYAYILNTDGTPVAITNTNLRGGAIVRWGWQRCEERLNPNREWNLVNARNGKISRAKRHDSELVPWAVELSPSNFYIAEVTIDD
jgi:hypothetical protein